MLYAQTLPIEQWTASTVDEILTEEDRLYLDALVSRSIPDTETLSLNYLPSVARCCVDSNTNNQYLLAAFHLQFVILVIFKIRSIFVEIHFKEDDITRCRMFFVFIIKVAI